MNLNYLLEGYVTEAWGAVNIRSLLQHFQLTKPWGIWMGSWSLHSKGLNTYLCQRYSSCFGRYFVFCLSVGCWNPYCSLMCHFTPLKITSDNSGGSKITGVTEYPQYAGNQVTNFTQLALLLISPLFPFFLSPVLFVPQLFLRRANSPGPINTRGCGQWIVLE